MKYKRYILEFVVVALLMSLGLYYFIHQTWQSALFIGSTTALLTVINKYFLDRKALRKHNNTKP
ncbi:hypothetical protein H1R17_05260 [Flavobacterium sp. xlx-214]|uniref:hypothetical protein n=1 Tax=unclassified Flavobacterium TaxID=196869 RepID=UPI0013CF8246|nr:MULTISPECIES: hypothetical protein [unclassified Flavobacterium]MBA5793611.1 hypothetical protein [Flavobacterium sp. xlx-221]QMI84540.1 hypothetical protein H1R17_05260 [Flavobacterium sp. xlx-214]